LSLLNVKYAEPWTKKQKRDCGSVGGKPEFIWIDFGDTANCGRGGGCGKGKKKVR